MRLTYHQCIQCKVPHRACNMVSEIMTQTPDKARWKWHNVFLLPALNNSHSDQALQTCCYQAPGFATLSRTCPPSKQEEKVHLVTVGMQELSRASLQARRSQGPGSESLQRAKLPDQRVCTWEGQASMGGLFFVRVETVGSLAQVHWFSHLQVSRSPTIKILMILQCWWAHPILDEPRHKLQHLLLGARSIVSLCSLTHLIENIDQWKIGR